MLKRTVGAALAIMSCSASLAQTVTLSLTSEQNGKTVAPGATIAWTIRARVSTQDNAGLALICCDLVQDPANPKLIDLPPADPQSLDATMRNFDRPAGIANPGEGGATSGYVGVQRSPKGRSYKNLVQIGGAQNVFGVAQPEGSGIAENDTVTAGVGQGADPQPIVSGALIAPDTPGRYTLEISNGLATVLETANTPPQHSPVRAASVSYVPARITFVVRALESPRTGTSRQPDRVQRTPP